jgi:hypothetical protein
MMISYENMILNKSMILHLYNYAKEKVLKSFYDTCMCMYLGIYEIVEM